MNTTTLRTILYGLVLLAVGCNFKQTGKINDNGTPSRGTIGLSVLTLTNPFFTVIADSLSLEAKKHGYDDARSNSSTSDNDDSVWLNKYKNETNKKERKKAKRIQE